MACALPATVPLPSQPRLFNRLHHSCLHRVTRRCRPAHTASHQQSPWGPCVFMLPPLGCSPGKCAVVLWAALVGPEKKYTFQEGLLVVNWAQIHNQSLVAIPRGASHTALQRVLAELPPSARLPPAQRPCEGGAETYPHQSQLHSCIFICILNDQSKQFYHDSNQSGQCHFVQTVQIWNLHLHKIGLIRKEGGNFL